MQFFIGKGCTGDSLLQTSLNRSHKSFEYATPPRLNVHFIRALAKYCFTPGSFISFVISRAADFEGFPIIRHHQQWSATTGRNSSETPHEWGGCEAGYEIQTNSSGNTTSVEADPYFLLRARMIFHLERSRKINSTIGKW